MSRDFGRNAGSKWSASYKVSRVKGLDFPSHGMEVEVVRRFGHVTIRVGPEVVLQGHLSDGKCSGDYYQDGYRFELTFDANSGKLRCDVFPPGRPNDAKTGTWTADEDGG